MSVWILYDSPRYKRNVAFAHKLQTEFEKCGCAVRLIVDGRIPENEPLPDVAIMRFVDADLSKRLEGQGVRVVNNSCASRICNDKWLSYQFVQSIGVPILPTKLVFKVDVLRETNPIVGFPKDWEYPVVLKSRFGHGGTEVFLADSPDALRDAFRKIPDDSAIIQKPASDLGKDVRVYILNGQILIAMLRESKSDFRSNYCLGGTARQYLLNEEQQAVVKRITDHLPLDFAGIDFIFDYGRIVFNEIEDVVGCRMIYSLTDLDPANLLAQKFC